jgi:hypothetical protein
VKEIEKPAVINPKGKLLIDPNIKWDRCELIIMYKGASAKEQLPPQRKRSKSEAPARVLPDMKNKKKAVSFKQKEVKELLSEIRNSVYFICMYTMPD